MEIVFRKYDKCNKIDMFNKKLAKISKGRFELRISKNGLYYLYDYDFKELSRNKEEIQDILECMQLWNEFKEVK